MKRVDLHIHTLSTQLDDDFEFDMGSLKEHVLKNELDIIAVTNHNLFSRDNYLEVREALRDTLVLPGIEVSVEGFHVLVIASIGDIDTFDSTCSQVKQIRQDEQGMPISLFISLFGDGGYLVIPHYRKKPSIRETDLQRLEGYIDALEVSSPKKWASESKTMRFPVVMFSDYRCRTHKVPPLGHYVYLDIADLSFEAMKLAIKDKSKISISQKDGLMELAPGLYASTGLNVVFGGRSTGKTYLLDSIQQSYSPDDIVYIPQFGIVSKAADEPFRKIIESDEAAIKDSYYEPMRRIAEAAKKLPSKESQGKSIKDYVQGLIEYAETTSLEDEYSKCILYQEQPLKGIDLEPYKRVIKAVQTLLEENGPLKNDINRLIGHEPLIGLLNRAFERYSEAAKKNWCNNRANSIVGHIKQCLASKSSRPFCPESPLVDCAKRVAFMKRLSALRAKTKVAKEIERHTVGRFTSVTCRRDYRNATSLKKALGIAQSESLSRISAMSDRDYVETLLEKCNTAAFEKALFDIEVSLKNDRNENISGGQRAEYLFLRALDKAGSHDIVIIDEPESSFDNPFLFESIAKKLKEISDRATVFVSTHNNVLGVSMQPDALLHTVVGEDDSHKVYYGLASSAELVSPDGSTENRSEALLSLMEAGAMAYNERRPYYGSAANG